MHLDTSPSSCCAHLGKASQEPVGNGDVDVELEGAEDAHLHSNELFPFVGIIADVEKVIHAWWVPLLPGHNRSAP